jgi:hypothetical protein
LVGPPNINVGPSLPFHPLHFLFFSFLSNSS